MGIRVPLSELTLDGLFQNLTMVQIDLTTDMQNKAKDTYMDYWTKDLRLGS